MLFLSCHPLHVFEVPFIFIAFVVWCLFNQIPSHFLFLIFKRLFIIVVHFVSLIRIICISLNDFLWAVIYIYRDLVFCCFDFLVNSLFRFIIIWLHFLVISIVFRFSDTPQFFISKQFFFSPYFFLVFFFILTRRIASWTFIMFSAFRLNWFLWLCCSSTCLLFFFFNNGLIQFFLRFKPWTWGRINHVVLKSFGFSYSGLGYRLLRWRFCHGNWCCFWNHNIISEEWSKVYQRTIRQFCKDYIVSFVELIPE